MPIIITSNPESALGGGDAKYLGVYADLTALTTAHPTAVDGSTATVTAPTGNLYYYSAGWIDTGTGFFGDMLKAVYDPTNKSVSAFSMGNMDETVGAKILTSAERSEIAANTLKVSNVSTDLSVGTRTATTMDVNSSDGNNASLPVANVTQAGLLSSADQIKVNNTSGTNTGDQTNITGNAATVTTNADLTGPITSVGNATTVTDDSITNAMAANLPANTMKGNNTGGVADPKDLTVAEIKTLLGIIDSPIVQVVRKEITAVASTSTVVALGTTPVSTDGDAYESLAITLAAANTVRIQMVIPVDGDNDAQSVLMLVSRLTVMVGLGAVAIIKKNLVNKNIVIDMYDTPGIGTHTYNFRVATTMNTAKFNQGAATANPWGGTLFRKNATITLTELT